MSQLSLSSFLQASLGPAQQVLRVLLNVPVHGLPGLLPRLDHRGHFAHHRNTSAGGNLLLGNPRIALELPVWQNPNEGFSIWNNHTRCQLNRLHSYWHNYSPFNRAPIRFKTLFIEIKDSFFRFPLQSPFMSMTSILLEYWDRWSVVKKNMRKLNVLTNHEFF